MSAPEKAPVTRPAPGRRGAPGRSQLHLNQHAARFADRRTRRVRSRAAARRAQITASAEDR